MPFIRISSFSKSLERRCSTGFSGNGAGSSFLIFPMLICLASSLIILSTANSFKSAPYISPSSRVVGCFCTLYPFVAKKSTIVPVPIFSSFAAVNNFMDLSSDIYYILSLLILCKNTILILVITFIRTQLAELIILLLQFLLLNRYVLPIRPLLKPVPTWPYLNRYV